MMRYVDPRLSKLLAERMVAEAERRPRSVDHRPKDRDPGLKQRMGSWLITAGERLARRDTELA